MSISINVDLFIAYPCLNILVVLDISVARYV